MFFVFLIGVSMMTIGLIKCGANGAQKTGSNLLFLHSSINTSLLLRYLQLIFVFQVATPSPQLGLRPRTSSYFLKRYHSNDILIMYMQMAWCGGQWEVYKNKYLSLWLKHPGSCKYNKFQYKITLKASFQETVSI